MSRLRSSFARFRRAAPAAVVLCLGACEPVQGPTAGTPPPNDPTVSRTAQFDVGEIKRAAEYSEEPRFAEANLERGELLSLACAACHTFRAGEKHNVGPNLHGVFGRRAASLPGFDYSSALRESGLVWTPRSIEAWLVEPARFVPGTTMAFTGYASEADRRDLLAYLLRATD